MIVKIGFPSGLRFSFFLDGISDITVFPIDDCLVIIYLINGILYYSVERVPVLNTGRNFPESIVQTCQLHWRYMATMPSLCEEHNPS
jgi:hypothetical protein